MAVAVGSAGNRHPHAEPQLALLDLDILALAQRVLAAGAVVGRVFFGGSVSRGRMSHAD